MKLILDFLDNYEVSLISHFGISRITLQLYHTKIKILPNLEQEKFCIKKYYENYLYSPKAGLF
jgi:hypothetical protein